MNETELTALGIIALVCLYLAKTIWSVAGAKEAQTDSQSFTIEKLFAQWDKFAESYSIINESIKAQTAAIQLQSAQYQKDNGILMQAMAAIQETAKEISTIIARTLDNDENIVASVNDLSANVGAYTEKVKEVGGEIMTRAEKLDGKIEKIDAVLAELASIRQSLDAMQQSMNEDIQSLKVSLNSEIEALRESITGKAKEYEGRIDTLEESVTALKPQGVEVETTETEQVKEKGKEGNG